jgi:transposase
MAANRPETPESALTNPRNPPQLSNSGLDRGYDATTVRTDLAGRHIDDVVIARRRRRGEPKTPGRRPLLLGLRWTVERTNSWLSNHGQLRRNTDRTAVHRLAQLALAITLIITAKLIDWHDRWNRC